MAKLGAGILICVALLQMLIPSQALLEDCPSQFAEPGLGGQAWGIVAEKCAKDLQTILNSVNGASLKIDGIIGPLTTTAIKAFQSANTGLQVDGIVGPATKSKLLAKFAERSTPPPPKPAQSQGCGDAQSQGCVETLVLIYEDSDPSFLDRLSSLSDNFQDILDNTGGVIGKIIDTTGAVLDTLGNKVGDVVIIVQVTVGDLVGDVKDKAGKIIGKVKEKGGPVVDKVGKVLGKIKKIPFPRRG